MAVSRQQCPANMLSLPTRSQKAAHAQPPTPQEGSTWLVRFGRTCSVALGALLQDLALAQRTAGGPVNTQRTFVSTFTHWEHFSLSIDKIHIT